MKNRLGGEILRHGKVHYYPFQRARSGAKFVQQLVDQDFDLKEFSARMTVDGKQIIVPGPKFLAWAEKYEKIQAKSASVNGNEARLKKAKKNLKQKSLTAKKAKKALPVAHMPAE